MLKECAFVQDNKNSLLYLFKPLVIQLYNKYHPRSFEVLRAFERS